MNSTTSFTFLATLFVLLLISASIIFRSFLIRRRFRQRVDGALAQGTIIDLQPSGLGLTSRFIGEKPRVHEAWVEQSGMPQEKAHWQAIMVRSELNPFIRLRGSTYTYPLASQRTFNAQCSTRRRVLVTQ